MADAGLRQLCAQAIHSLHLVRFTCSASFISPLPDLTMGGNVVALTHMKKMIFAVFAGAAMLGMLVSELLIALRS